MPPATTHGSQPGDCRVISNGRAYSFSAPESIITAAHSSEVWPALRRVQAAVDAGKVAVGYIAYEAAPAFDRALVTHAEAELPLLWFAIFGAFPEPDVPPPVSASPADSSEWTHTIAEPEYKRALERIREWIAAGDTYQVNYTFPLTAPFGADAHTFFLELCHAQPTENAIFLDCGNFAVASVSPELFFHLDGNRLTTRPMKGTAPRGLWRELDALAAERLVRSPKERAENVMIVDLLRNDMGRICNTGTVRVEQLCAAERYDTVWQMTSTITGETGATITEIFRALFPSGSVTGAPKVRTMQIIRELEPQPRGVYCGAIGWWGPNRQALFNVAIRTVTIDRETNTATYPIGSGITWDSLPEAEYAECKLKAAALTRRRPEFDLLETMRWSGTDFDLMSEHLHRLTSSADYFGFTFDVANVAQELLRFADTLGAGDHKVRLLLSRRGKVSLGASPLGEYTPQKTGIAPEPVDTADVFLYHKTTHRVVYERARAAHPDCDEVLLWNERRELTEATIANVVIERAGRLITPAVKCGLLPGTLRAKLLADGRISEGIVTLDELPHVQRLWLINGVRGWVPVPITALARGETATSTS